jgi:hypothetical protein
VEIEYEESAERYNRNAIKIDPPPENTPKIPKRYPGHFL